MKVNKSVWLRILTAMLALCLLIPAVGAIADVTKGTTMYVDNASGSNVNLRSGPSSDCSIIAVYSVGTPVTLLVSGRDWSKVSVGYCVGYMDSSYLSLYKPQLRPIYVTPKPGSAYAYVRTNGARLNLRATPSRASAILGQFLPGTAVIIYEKIGAWYRVNICGINGYVMSQYVSVTYGEPTSNYMRVTNPNGGSYVNLRKGAGLGYKTIQRVPVNVLVTVLERGSDWTKVTYNGTMGYMSSYFLKSK